MSNHGARRIVAACLSEATIRALSPGGMLNFMGMMFERSEMRPKILNWPSVGSRLVARLRKEAGGDPQSPSAALLQELGPSADCGSLSDNGGTVELPIIPLDLHVNGSTLRLFNTITTFGTPQDIGLQELRIEMSYPMDSQTRALLGEPVERPPGSGGTPAALPRLQTPG